MCACLCKLGHRAFTREHAILITLNVCARSNTHLLSCVERRLEDHEKVLDVVSRWPEKNSNTLQLRDAPSKYALFEKPQVGSGCGVDQPCG